MESYLIWLVIGLLLVIAELLSGTFYLLFLGVAALVASAVAWFGAAFWQQAVLAALFAITGVLWVQRHKQQALSPQMAALDVGEAVSFESWLSQPDRLARVKYRDAQWDARINGECAGQVGEILYIHAVSGNQLQVAKARPS